MRSNMRDNAERQIMYNICVTMRNDKRNSNNAEQYHLLIELSTRKDTYLRQKLLFAITRFISDVTSLLLRLDA